MFYTIRMQDQGDRPLPGISHIARGPSQENVRGDFFANFNALREAGLVAKTKNKARGLLAVGEGSTEGVAQYARHARRDLPDVRDNPHGLAVLLSKSFSEVDYKVVTDFVLEYLNDMKGNNWFHIYVGEEPTLDQYRFASEAERTVLAEGMIVDIRKRIEYVEKGKGERDKSFAKLHLTGALVEALGMSTIHPRALQKYLDLGQASFDARTGR